MKNLLIAVIALFFIIPFALHAQKPKDLTIKTRIDSTYVFAFDLTESRSAKGGIWNVKTGKAETPLSYTKIKKDTIDGQPVIMLYREVALGNHPLNRWETWMLKDDKWINAEEIAEAKETPSFAGSFYEVLSSEDETPCVLEIDYNAKTKKATGQWIVPKGFGEDVFPQIADVQGKLVNGIIKLGGEAGLAEYELDVVYIDENTITINGNKYTKK